MFFNFFFYFAQYYFFTLLSNYEFNYSNFSVFFFSHFSIHFHSFSDKLSPGPDNWQQSSEMWWTYECRLITFSNFYFFCFTLSHSGSWEIVLDPEGDEDGKYMK